MMCEEWLGTKSCASTRDVHPYTIGPRCAIHTPAAVAGRREAWGQDEPLVRHHVYTGETALDQRHRDSGKRASGAIRRASHES